MNLISSTAVFILVNSFIASSSVIVIPLFSYISFNFDTIVKLYFFVISGSNLPSRKSVNLTAEKPISLDASIIACTRSGVKAFNAEKIRKS